MTQMGASVRILNTGTPRLNCAPEAAAAVISLGSERSTWARHSGSQSIIDGSAVLDQHRC